jgi:hypothetical protein
MGHLTGEFHSTREEVSTAAERFEQLWVVKDLIDLLTTASVMKVALPRLAASAVPATLGMGLVAGELHSLEGTMSGGSAWQGNWKARLHERARELGYQPCSMTQTVSRSPWHSACGLRSPQKLTSSAPIRSAMRSSQHHRRQAGVRSGLTTNFCSRSCPTRKSELHCLEREMTDGRSWEGNWVQSGAGSTE